MNFGKKRRDKGEVYSASLNDIMFFLLLFFLIASTLVTSNGLSLSLPSANGQVVADKNVTVSITKDLEYFLNNNPVTLAEIKPSLEKELATQSSPTVIVYADKDIPLDYVVQVMAIVKDLNAKMVLATEPAAQ